jgi:hypothetical protein
VSNSAIRALDRYWRWYAGEREVVSLNDYARLVWYSLKVLVPRDLAEGDLQSVTISLLCPHYQFWKSWWRQLTRRVQF